MQKLALTRKGPKGVGKQLFLPKTPIGMIGKTAFGLPAIMPLRGLLGRPRVLVADIPRDGMVRAAVKWEDTSSDIGTHAFDFIVVYGKYDPATGGFSYITYDGYLLGGIVENVVATATPMTTNIDAYVPDIPELDGSWDAMTLICDYNAAAGFPDGIETLYDSSVIQNAITISGVVAPAVAAKILEVVFSSG